MMNEKKDIIVYGSFNDMYVNFLKKDVAEYYAEIWRSHKEGITFGELQIRYPWLLNIILESGMWFSDVSDLPDAENHDCDSYFDLLFERFCEDDLIDDADISDFRRIYENEYERSERLPIISDMFNEDFIIDSDLLEILNYEPKMTWVPQEIINRFGKGGYSMFGDELLDFEIGDTEAIVEAFEQIGYRCVQHELLVAKAYGQA